MRALAPPSRPPALSVLTGRVLSVSLPSLSNVVLLVVIVYYIFSILAMRLFGKIGFSDGGLTRNANFRDWPTSILTLFRCAARLCAGFAAVARHTRMCVTAAWPRATTGRT